MKYGIIALSMLLVMVFGLAGGVVAYETYEISENQLESGYTINMSPGDKLTFDMGDNEAYVALLSVYLNGAEMGIFAHDRKLFYTSEHPASAEVPSERNFEMTEDNYYDLRVVLNKATLDDDPRIASITVEKIEEEILEGTEIYYDCWKYFECSNGETIKYCDYNSDGRCGCNAISSLDCKEELGCEDDEVWNTTSEKCENLDEDGENETEKDDDGREGLGKRIRGRVKAGVYTDEDGRQIRVRDLAKIREEWFGGNYTNFKSEFEFEFESENGNNKTKMKIKTKNGRLREIKVMPRVASERALERLKLKVCNDDNNCTLELKEVGNGNNTKVRYEIQAERHYKILGLFKAKARERIEVDAETGEVVGKGRAWWRWLAVLDEKEEVENNSDN